MGRRPAPRICDCGNPGARRDCVGWVCVRCQKIETEMRYEHQAQEKREKLKAIAAREAMQILSLEESTHESGRDGLRLPPRKAYSRVSSLSRLWAY